MSLDATQADAARVLAGQSDESLMERFRADLDEAAVEELFHRHSAAGLAVATHFLHDRQRAEDALQEGFLRLVRHRRRYRTGSPFGPWFYTLLRNACRDMIRRAKVLDEYRARLAFEQAPEVQSEEGRRVLRMLDRLEPDDRTVITLKVCHSLSCCDVAVALEISVEAAKKRAQRALRRLRELAGVEAR